MEPINRKPRPSAYSTRFPHPFVSDIYSRVPQSTETVYQVLRVPNGTRCQRVALASLVLGLRPHDLVPKVNIFNTRLATQVFIFLRCC